MAAQDLVEVASYPTSFEAALARNSLEVCGIRACLDGEAMASWFWQFGGAIGGVRVLVERDQADDARRALAELAAESGEEWPEEPSESQQVTSEVQRAWRAAVIGLFLMPPLLNLYSMWVLLKNGLLTSASPQPGNWRVPAALLVNLGVFTLIALLFWHVFSPASSRSFPWQPVELEETFEIPVVPYAPAGRQ